MELKHYLVGQKFEPKDKPRPIKNITNLVEKDKDGHTFVPIGSVAGGVMPLYSQTLSISPERKVSPKIGNFDIRPSGYISPNRHQPGQPKLSGNLLYSLTKNLIPEKYKHFNRS